MSVGSTKWVSLPLLGNGGEGMPHLTHAELAWLDNLAPTPGAAG